VLYFIADYYYLICRCKYENIEMDLRESECRWRVDRVGSGYGSMAITNILVLKSGEFLDRLGDDQLFK
jgi:hypothetical protein